MRVPQAATGSLNLALRSGGSAEGSVWAAGVSSRCEQAFPRGLEWPGEPGLQPAAWGSPCVCPRWVFTQSCRMDARPHEPDPGFRRVVSVSQRTLL